MKKLFTFVALALMAVGANAERVYNVVYSNYAKFPFYVMDYTPTWVDGIMTDDGATQDPVVEGWHQYFIADGIKTIAGNDYVVKALVRASSDITININMGWGWGEGQTLGASVNIPKSSEFVEVVWEYKGVGGTNCNLVAQPWSNPKIEWKELSVYTKEAEYTKVYGDLKQVTPTIIASNYGGSQSVAEPDAEGVYTVEDKAGSGEAWATQFFISAPEALPAGQKFFIEFDYKADAEGKVGNQTQGKPGSYITHHCIGDLNFTTEWQTVSKEVTLESDMNGWQTVAFNMHLNSDTKYYFKNIVLKVPEVVSEVVGMSVGAAGWATFSSKYAVDLGSAKGYKAKYNGSSVSLTPVAEVPANNAVLIEGAGKYEFNVIPTATTITDNDLLVSDGSTTSEGHFFALAEQGGVVGFYKVKSGVTIPAGKAYLSIPAASRDFIGFDFGGETTGIEKASIAIDANAPVYNLNGQRVAQPTRGLYIVNGKKVIIK